MDESGQLYADEDAPEEDVERAEKEWGDEVERKFREIEKKIEKEQKAHAGS